jgi:hypothetical protein
MGTQAVFILHALQEICDRFVVNLADDDGHMPCPPQLVAADDGPSLLRTVQQQRIPDLGTELRLSSSSSLVGCDVRTAADVRASSICSRDARGHAEQRQRVFLGPQSLDWSEESWSLTPGFENCGTRPSSWAGQCRVCSHCELRGARTEGRLDQPR